MTSESIVLGGQVLKLDRERKLLTLILNKGLLFGVWKKLGLTKKTPAIGLNGKIVDYAIQNRCVVEVRHNWMSYYIGYDVLESVIQKDWFLKEVGYGMKIFCIPVTMTQRNLSNCKARIEHKATGSLHQRVIEEYAR